MRAVMHVTIPDPEMFNLELVPRQVMQAAYAERLSGRVYLGRPYTELLQVGPDRSRRLLSVPVNFTAKTDEPVIDTTVGVALQYHAATARAERPVARDITPRILTRSVALSATVGITADFKFARAEAQRSVSDSGGEAFMLANGLGHHQITWSFKRTRHQELEGFYDLQIITETASDKTAFALVVLSSTIRQRKGRVIGYEAKMPPELAVVEL
jgi:hypothetical protein